MFVDLHKTYNDCFWHVYWNNLSKNNVFRGWWFIWFILGRHIWKWQIQKYCCFGIKIKSVVITKSIVISTWNWNYCFWTKIMSIFLRIYIIWTYNITKIKEVGFTASRYCQQKVTEFMNGPQWRNSFMHKKSKTFRYIQYIWIYRERG